MQILAGCWQIIYYKFYTAYFITEATLGEHYYLSLLVCRIHVVDEFSQNFSKEMQLFYFHYIGQPMFSAPQLRN